MHVLIQKFGTTLVSRPSGKEAYLAFQPTLKNLGNNESLIIDFTGVITLTPSWADEFLTPLFGKYGERITMKNTENASIYETLQMLKLN